MTLVFIEDSTATDLAPFSLTRPACELRAGAELVRRRWEVALGLPTSGFVGAPHLDDFDERGAVSRFTGVIPAGAILVNSRCAISLAAAPTDAFEWRCDGRLAAVRLRSPADAADARSIWRKQSENGGEDAADVRGWWIDHVWDAIGVLSAMLSADVPELGKPVPADRLTGTRIGTGDVFIEQGATIEPFVVFDTTSGPILVRRHATVRSFSRLEGPCMIGERTTVHGGRIATSSIGDHCRVSGEVSTSIFTGHANKAHDGFLGHSILGRWVNLGASTVCSNLKNTYGQVSMATPDGPARTGLQFLGAMLGDHARTAIGTRLTTGCVVGAGANVLATGITPKAIPPFTWGSDGETRWELDRFLATVERVMQRRGESLSDKARRQLTAAFHLSSEPVA